MKKLFILLMISVCGMIASAATKYEINIAGTEVTSDNCNYIAPASNNGITEGYAVYNPSSNTLTLYSINIRRSGNGNYAIHNRKCDNLTIVFKGYCDVGSADHGMNLARSTTIVLDAGSYVTVHTGGSTHALNLGSYTYYIQGTGDLLLDGKNAIHGNGSGSTTVYFQGTEITVQSRINNCYNHALESFKAVFKEGANLTIKSNDSYTSVNNVSMYFYGRETVLTPAGAYYSNSAIYTSSGSQVTSQDIYISDQYVAKLTSDYFPDANFRYYLSTQFPKGYITTSDVNATTSLNASSEYISSLQGLEYFTKLVNFACEENNLTSLPSLPSTLKTLRCGKNKLTSLPSMPSGLTFLDCYANQLTSLPTFTSSLQTLECEDNKLSGTVNLCNLSGLKTLKISNNPSMTTLLCYNDALTSLDITGCTGLTTLDCHNNQLTTLIVVDHRALKTLNVSYNTGLTTLNCYRNAITSLNISGCSALETLNCRYNNLTSLPSLPSTLTTLKCADNQLTSLPSLPSTLTTLDCSNNQLTSLPALPSGLKYLLCSFCKLTALSVQRCNALTYLGIYGNQIKSNAMGALVNSLPYVPDNTRGHFAVLYIYNGEGNEITNAQVVAAQTKNWRLVKHENDEWVEILDDTVGDVNGDGKVNVSDVTALVNMILGTIPKNEAVADINGDGKVNVSDVTALVNLILGVQ